MAARPIPAKLTPMTFTDYAISAALVLLVIPQVRGVRLSLRSLVLPLVAVAAAAAHYLKSVPTAGNDVALDIALGAVGLALGVLCGLGTRITRDAQGHQVAKAGFAAAALWILGMIARNAFVYEAEHGGAHAITDFSRTHLITGAAAWTAALLLMALVQVVARTAVLRVKAYGIGHEAVPTAA